MIFLKRLEVFINSAITLFLFHRCFHTQFLKLPSSAVLHFNIARQMTTTVSEIQTVLGNRTIPGIYSGASLLSARRSVRTTIAGDFKILPDSTC